MRTRVAILVGLILLFVGVFVLFQGGLIDGGGPAKSGVEPLDENQLVSSYVRLAALAEQYAIGTPEYEAERDRLLGEIGVTHEQVEQTLAYYDERPGRWKPIWEKIQRELAEQIKSAQPVQSTDTTSSNP